MKTEQGVVMAGIAVHSLVAAAMARIARQEELEIAFSNAQEGFEHVYGKMWAMGAGQLVVVRYGALRSNRDNLTVLTTLEEKAKVTRCACERQIGKHYIYAPAHARTVALPCLTEQEQERLQTMAMESRPRFCQSPRCLRRNRATHRLVMGTQTLGMFCQEDAEFNLRSVQYPLDT